MYSMYTDLQKVLNVYSCTNEAMKEQAHLQYNLHIDYQ